MRPKANMNSLSVEQRHRLIEEQLKKVERLAWGILNRYSLPAHMLEDMVEEGKLGLVEAASRYREIKGGGFASYATSYIRGKMLTSLKNIGFFESRITDVHLIREDKGSRLFDEKLEQVLDQLDQLRQSGRLTERQAAAVKGRLKDRKTFVEVGKEMGIRGCEVRSHFYNALSKIGLTLAGYKAENAREARLLRRQRVVNRVRSAIPSGMSIEKLAVSIGISPSYFLGITKETIPSLTIALILAKELGKPVEELFQLDESKEANHGASNG